MTTTQILEKEFKAISEELVAKYDELGMRASGDWEKSLELQVEDSGGVSTGRVTGNDYTEQLVDGREPGKFPPIQAIEQWIKDKGIAYIESEIKLSSLAFLIARKIAQEGTEYYKQGGTDLVEAVFTPKRIQVILDQLKEINVQIITDGLIKELKNTR